jgi:hypothetical protein
VRSIHLPFTVPEQVVLRSHRRVEFVALWIPEGAERRRSCADQFKPCKRPPGDGRGICPVTIASYSSRGPSQHREFGGREPAERPFPGIRSVTACQEEPPRPGLRWRVAAASSGVQERPLGRMRGTPAPHRKKKVPPSARRTSPAQ